ncbi:MAG: threonylcarbamoyl-AMP synthase [Dehalococcoidia bacterium]|nr:threonylcarbamoyl-AMP synthase [Dehalococcoidia bacterium]
MNALQRDIDHAVDILKQGGVVAFPTDTVYGLGADAFNSEAVARTYEIKGRPKDRPLPLLIADVERSTALVKPIPGIARFLARRFWPGGLTLVLSKADRMPAHLSAGEGIAIRVPDHPVCRALLQGLSGPMIGTSANLSGRPSALTADEVSLQLGERVDSIVNGGECPGGRESTVVDVRGQTPVVLREGIIPSYEIDKVCQEYLRLHEGREDAGAPGTPGGPDTRGLSCLYSNQSTSAGGSGL